MDRLRSPGGCPWDAEQTHQSLAPVPAGGGVRAARGDRGGRPGAPARGARRRAAAGRLPRPAGRGAAGGRSASRSTTSPPTWWPSWSAGTRTSSPSARSPAPPRWRRTGRRSRRRRSGASRSPTGCRSGQPALALAAKLRRRAEKAGLRRRPAGRRRPRRAAVRAGRRGGGGGGGSGGGAAGHRPGLPGRGPCRRGRARGRRLSRGSCRVRTTHGRHPEQRRAGQHGGEQEADLAAVVHVRPEQAEDRRGGEQPGVGTELPGQRDVGADDAVGALRVDALAVDRRRGAAATGAGRPARRACRRCRR